MASGVPGLFPCGPLTLCPLRRTYSKSECMHEECKRHGTMSNPPPPAKYYHLHHRNPRRQDTLAPPIPPRSTKILEGTVGQKLAWPISLLSPPLVCAHCVQHILLKVIYVFCAYLKTDSL